MEYHLKSIRPEDNRFRFYNIVVLHDLFGSVHVLRHWGRIGTRGKTGVLMFDTLDEALAECRRILSLRRNHGYR